jgi:hypothetical protein
MNRKEKMMKTLAEEGGSLNFSQKNNLQKLQTLAEISHRNIEWAWKRTIINDSEFDLLRHRCSGFLCLQELRCHT